MKHTTIAVIKESTDSQISLAGWVVNKRSSGSLLFVDFRDGSGMIQLVFNKSDFSSDEFDTLNHLGLESSLVVSGTLQKNDKNQLGYELQVDKFNVIQNVEFEFPIGKKEHGIDFLLENRHLWLRSLRQWAIQRIRFQVTLSIFDYFNKHGFIKFDSPIFTPNACEGTSDLFPVTYTDDSLVYLSQSGQLYLEAAIFSFGKVFDFGPTFRAEKSKTRRHLTEFWMIDAEMAYLEHEDNLSIQAELLSHIIETVAQECILELSILDRTLTPIILPIKQISYDEVIKQLQDFGSDTKYGEDLGNDDETILTKDQTQPLLIEKYPAEIKAFYMKRDLNNDKLALCNDLLAPEGYGEIIGGSQREDDYSILENSIKDHNLSLDDFKWYLDLRKYGSVPHSGFGLGLERLIAWICKLDHVREAIPFPRTIYRVYP